MAKDGVEIGSKQEIDEKQGSGKKDDEIKNILLSPLPEIIDERGCEKIQYDLPRLQ